MEMDTAGGGTFIFLSAFCQEMLNQFIICFIFILFLSFISKPRPVEFGLLISLINLFSANDTTKPYSPSALTFTDKLWHSDTAACQFLIQSSKGVAPRCKWKK